MQDESDTTERVARRSGPDASRRFWRWGLLGLTLVAVAASALAFEQARDRRDDIVAVTPQFGPDAYDLVVTSPFTEGTTVWTLPSNATQLIASDEGTPILRIGGRFAGAVAGIETERGLVGLALVPPGLAEQPVELLVSPASTALALVGLHPDVLTSDPATYRSRLVAAARSPRFDDLAAVVDGVTPIAEFGEPARAALSDVLVAVVASAAGAEATCANSTPVGGPIVRCPLDSSFLNLGPRGVLIGDGAGNPCALVPPVTRRASLDERASLTDLVGLGTSFDRTLTARNEVESGRLEPPPLCGANPLAIVDPNLNPDWIDLSARYAILSDDLAPMSRVLSLPENGGALRFDIDQALTDSLRPASLGPGATPDARTRLTVVSEWLREPTVLNSLGLAPNSTASSDALAELFAVLKALYR